MILTVMAHASSLVMVSSLYHAEDAPGLMLSTFSLCVSDFFFVTSSSAIQPPAKYLLPEMIISDYGKKCVVIDLDETLVHSSFKVGVAFKALNRKSHYELKVPALSFISTMFIIYRYIYSKLSQCVMNGMMCRKWKEVLQMC